MKKKEYIDAINEIKADESLKQNTLHKLKDNKKGINLYKFISVSVIILVLSLSIAIPASINKNKTTQIESIEENNGLPKLENFENFYNIMKENKDETVYYETSINSATDSIQEESGAQTAEEDIDYSETNVQVEGVDEADIVKTDGDYIYYISNNGVVIINAEDSKNLEIQSKLSYEDSNFYPQELYISNNKLIVIGQNEIDSYKTLIEADMYYSTTNTNQTYTVAKVYNVDNKSKPELIREVEVMGEYLSSRMINENVYFMTNIYIYPYVFCQNSLEEIDQEEFKPKYKDTAVNSEEKIIDYADIYYFPESDDTSFLNVAGFNINSNEEVNVETYLGAGDEIYSSENNLYITRVKYEYKDSNLYGYYSNYDVNTYIYKFKLEGGKATYVNAGSVNGEVLNQFSMDEKDGYFRIATTDSDSWNSETNKNNLYVLDENLKTVGSIENLAKGEKIYSVRFMGDRAYMVTFVETDPLFVIDLSDATNPKVLGELKIPGYSKYLQPYDETHIIGFGENTKTNENGGVITDGMKMALFDVSNPSNPKELYSVDIGEKGTYSEILDNHKALLFSKEKNIIAFPISISEESGNYRTKLTFQGAIVYEINLEKGFTLKGTIAHMQVENGYQDYDYSKEVQRIIYIKDSLYTLSEGLIKSTNIETMEEEGKIEIL